MAQKRRPEPPPIVPKIFTWDEIERGIEKLRRRIGEVQSLDPTKLTHSDASVQTVQANVQDTIRDVFGPNSPEYSRHQHHWIWHGGINLYDGPRERQQKFAEGIVQTVKMLEGLVARLEEPRGDLAGDPSAAAQAVFEGMERHPRIGEVTDDLFRDGYYRQAVFDAAKVLVYLVKERSGRHDLDGANLMRTVFSVKDPILAFNELKDQADRDEQEGMMHLFEGAVLAIRNPSGHAFPEYDPDRALEYIALLSLLAKRASEAKRITRPPKAS